MQGDPLAMVAYGIAVILLIKKLKLVYLDINQPRYSDNLGALGMYNNIKLYF